MRYLPALSLLWITSPLATSAPALNCYVSPTGSDANTGSLEKPFLTLARAQAAVRALPGKANGDIIVWLRGGTYPLTSTLTFTPADSGGDGHAISYRAYMGETPILSGGKTVTGWAQHDASKNIWKARVEDTDNFRQIYVNGTKAVRARSKDAMGLKVAATGYTTNVTALQSYGNITHMEVVSRRPTMDPRDALPISAITGGTSRSAGLKPHPPLWIENAYEFMAKPGDWYLNRTTHILYYIPRSGEDMQTALIEVPVLEQLIQLDGKGHSPVANLRFEGLTFRLSNWLQPGIGAGLTNDQANQISPAVKGAVEFTGARNVAVSRCTFRELGGDGINLNEACQKDIIDRCHFFEIAASGIQCGSGSAKAAALPRGSADVVVGVVISNCTIHHIGTDYPAACAIYLGHVQSCTVDHNEIHTIPYTGISLGWGHSEKKIECSTGNRILNNKIHNHMRSMSDGGGIYCLAYQDGGLISGNYVYDQHAAYANLYLDDGSTNWTVKSNVCKTAGGPALWFLYKGSNNRADNNFADKATDYNRSATSKVSGLKVIAKGTPWPAEAEAIMKNAGVTPETR